MTNDIVLHRNCVVFILLLYTHTYMHSRNFGMKDLFTSCIPQMIMLLSDSPTRFDSWEQILCFLRSTVNGNQQRKTNGVMINFPIKNRHYYLFDMIFDDFFCGYPWKMDIINMVDIEIYCTKIAISC